MSESAKQSSRPPVNLKGLQELVLVSASLMRLNAQLRNFTPLRDRLVAHGQDASAAYRQIESRRDQVMAEPQETHPGPGSPGPSAKVLPPAASCRHAVCSHCAGAFPPASEQPLVWVLG